jgi:hypothetical protein
LFLQEQIKDIIINVEVRHGQPRENARFKPRALGGNRKLWSPAICAIKEISAACTGRRDIAILVKHDMRIAVIENRSKITVLNIAVTRRLLGT